MNENIQTTRLANGLTILTEKIPNLRSAAVGFWLRHGSRHEPEALNGILHFIEHTVFKGTPNNSALDIAIKTDKLGGNLDAYTMHETVGFSFHVVDKKVVEAFNLLADMLLNPLFDKTELKREQKVIIEEMKMVEDAPEELLSELFQARIFSAHALGKPIEGTRKTVKTFNHEVTKKFHCETFVPENLIIACAGNIEHEAIIELAAGLSFALCPSSVAVENSSLETNGQKTKDKGQTPKFNPAIFIKNKPDLEQAQLILATPFVTATDEKRYAASLLASILGGGNASRLWQKVREERGLAYSVGASAVSFQDCGILTIYAGTAPEKIGEVLEIAVDELRSLVKNGVTENELELVKEQSLASILLGLESTAVRAENLARQELVFGKQIPLAETLAKLEAVTTAEIQAIAQEFFTTGNIAVGALGDLRGFKVKPEMLEIK